jgi:peptidoglycan hydrolase-like protein with peptidoglycan-binding domain
LSDAEAKTVLMQSELGLGPDAEGLTVVALQRRLTDIGYFPNALLASDYPAWRPIVAQAPTPGVYDAATARAVTALQEHYGAEPTGRLDATVVALLTTERCSHPDGIDELDPSSKFNDHGHKRSGTVTWRLNQPPSNLTRAEVEGAIGRAFATWQAQQSDLTIQKSTTSTATITVNFADLGNNTYGACSHPGQTGGCTLNTRRTWSVATPTPTGAPPPNETLDVEAVMLHEAGHALGIAHSGICRTSEFPDNPGLCPQQSSLGHATMFPNFRGDSSRRSLATYDDYASISALYDQFDTLSGTAHDIGAANRTSGGAWKIGTTASGSNFRVESFSESTQTWTLDSTMTGVRIAVDHQNVPWVVKANGQIWTRSSGTWIQRPGCAKDIGIADAAGISHIWIIGCQPTQIGVDFYAEKWNGTTSTFVRDANTNFGGVRIAVGRFSNSSATPSIVPWFITNSGSVWRRNDGNVNSTTGWQLLPGGGLGKDIAVCGTGISFAWLIGLDDRLWMWREQHNNSTATKVEGWFSIGTKTSAARAVSCGSSLNRAWAVSSTGATTRTRR